MNSWFPPTGVFIHSKKVPHFVTTTALTNGRCIESFSLLLKNNLWIPHVLRFTIINLMYYNQIVSSFNFFFRSCHPLCVILDLFIIKRRTENYPLPLTLFLFIFLQVISSLLDDQIHKSYSSYLLVTGQRKEGLGNHLVLRSNALLVRPKPHTIYVWNSRKYP